MPHRPKSLIRQHPLWAFFVLAYVLTWVFTIPFVYVWRNVTDERFAWWMIFFLPGAYGPTFAAVIVTAMTEGLAGVRTLLGKFCQWRAPVGWWLFVVVAPLAVVLGAMSICGFGPAATTTADLGRALLVVPITLLVALPFGPLPEELGWRGYALPHLLSRYGIVTSSFIVGFFWHFWHIPMFWFPGAAFPSCLELSLTSVSIYLLMRCADSVTFTVAYLHTRGSVPVAITLHLFNNAASSILFGLTGEPPLGELRRINYVRVGLNCVLAAAVLCFHTVRSRSAVPHRNKVSASHEPPL
jgi:uncharacterized protein